MAYIQEKTKGKKIVPFKFKACFGRDANGKQIFKCWTWYPPADPPPPRLAKKPKGWLVSGRKKQFVSSMPC